MDIHLQGVSKRYRNEWIFKNLTCHLEAGTRQAIIGPNGSGKSTLLKILSGHLTPTRGSAVFSEQGSAVQAGDVYCKVSIAAPYIELIEEFSLLEAIRFHTKFKPLSGKMSAADLISLTGLGSSRHKEVRHFSSGMKQRLKLALALCSESPLVLLDEPTTNLDRQGAQWYLDLVRQFGQGKLLVVASNVTADYDFCEHRLDILDWKRN
jgi:ABC-type multidrug transport system ATPase subunit